MVLVAGALGMGAFWRRLRRRATIEPIGPDPAAELRQKLAESKAAGEPPAEANAGVESVNEPDAETLDPVERRRAVHERARGAIDELR